MDKTTAKATKATKATEKEKLAEALNEEVTAPKTQVEEMETAIEEAVVAKEKAKVEVATKLTAEDTVMVLSYFGGRMQLTNDEVAPYDSYVWEKFGEPQEVRFGTIEHFRRKSTGVELFTKMLYINDAQAVEQLGLARIYKDLAHPIDLPKILTKPLPEIIKFIEVANEATKQSLREILSDKLERKEAIDFYTVKIVAEKLDYQIMLDF